MNHTLDIKNISKTHLLNRAPDLKRKESSFKTIGHSKLENEKRIDREYLLLRARPKITLACFYLFFTNKVSTLLSLLVYAVMRFQQF